MCNEAGDVSRLGFTSQSLFELNKELAETEEKIRYLEQKRTEARTKGEREKLAHLDEWMQLLRGKAIRLRSEIDGF